MRMLFCTIDAGTSGVKVGLVDPSGRLVRSAYRGYGSVFPRPGFVEQRVEELFTAECEALAELLGGVDPTRVAAVACSSQRATVIGLEHGRLRPTYIGWQDRRGLAACDRMRDELGEQEFYARTGLVIDTVASWSKMRWLQRNDPGVDEYSTHQGVLLRQLGVEGNLCSPSEASYVGLFDKSGSWDAELAAMIDVDVDRLPEVVPSGTQVGEVHEPRVIEAGLPAGTPVVMGGGDLQLGVLGTGVVDPGTVASGIGTGGHCVTPLTEPLLDDERRINCLHHVGVHTWELEGLARASGAALRWMRDGFTDHHSAEAQRQGVDVYDLMTREAGQWPPGSDGLMFVPALAGLGSPVNAPQFTGALLGLRLPHDRAAVTRALMEGVCYEQRSILDAIVSLVGPPTEVRAWGGGAKSDPWCQMQADIYATPVARAREPDTSLIGAAICCGVATGAFTDMDDGAQQMVHVDRRWEPDATASATYQDYYQAYRAAVTTLLNSGLADQLDALTADDEPQ